MRLSCIVIAVLAGAVLGCKEDPSEAHHRKAAELFKKDDFAAAAAEYEEALKLNPKLDQKVYEKAAFAYLKAQKFDKSAEILLKTLDFKKTDAEKIDLYRNIAGMYLQGAQDGDKAEKYFNEALKLNPKDDQSIAWLAEIASIRGGARSMTAQIVPDQLQKAMDLYDKVIELTPASPTPYINKRIALTRYIENLIKQKQAVEADAETHKNDKDKATFDDLKQQATDYQARIDELKPKLDELTKKLGEVQKAAKAAAAGK